MIFQQDEVRAHFSTEVCTWLNGKFNGGWIDRGGPSFWPLRSPDLMSLDFFLWGYIKTRVYKTRINGVADLKERIEQEIKIINKETLENAFDGSVRRLKFCIDVNSDTFKQ